MRHALFALSFVCLTVAACIPPPPQVIGGRVDGLIGSVTLQNNGADDLALTSDGNFVFAVKTTVYNVTVSAQPPGQLCTVSSGTGAVQYEAVSGVVVHCAADANNVQAGNGDAVNGATYAVSGSITGLVGSVTLNLNNDFVTVTSPQTQFAFPKDLLDGAAYSLSVNQQPQNQTCTFSPASGTIQSANVTEVIVRCAAAVRTVSFTVQGSDGPVTVLNNGTDAFTSKVDGSYTFATGFEDGAKFNVTVFNEPTDQACVVPNGYGVLQGTSVSGININCQRPTTNYTISGTAAGLTGAVGLNNNGVESISVALPGTFTFPSPMTSGSLYNVTIASQPATQACNMTTVAGTTIIGSAKGSAYGNVSTLHLNCAAGYTVGGAVTGLTAGNKIRLINNGNANDVVTLTGSNTYAFARRLNDQSGYGVQVLTAPANQNCTVSNNASGIIQASNVAQANVSCTTTAGAQYTLGGYITGLNGNITLSNAGVESMVVTSNTNTAFTFATAMSNAAPYQVNVAATPAGYACALKSNVGTISGRNVTSVAVVCAPAGVINIPVTGLVGTMSIENSIGSTGVVSANGVYTMPGSFDTTAFIQLNVATAPNHQRCVLLRGVGTLASSSFAPVVRCGPSYAFVDGQNATTVIGQPDLLSRTCSLTSALGNNTLCNPYGHGYVTPGGELLLSDTANNRVLGFAGVPTSNGGNANLVLGQTSYDAYGAQASAAGLSQPSAIAGNANHTVVVDTDNNRVLIYTPQANTTGQAAAVVVGQSSLSGSGSNCTAATLNQPQGAFVIGNTLLIADSDNNRVLVYNSIPATHGAAADLVLGQPNMTTCSQYLDGAVDGNRLTTPTDVWSDGTSVLVADSFNNRVLIFSTFPTASGAYANLALGQTTLKTNVAAASSTNLAMPTAMTSNGMQIFVADSGNNRVAIWNALPSILDSGTNGAPFDHVLGQPFNNTNVCNGTGNIVAPATLCQPTGVAINGSSLIVTDTSNSRYTVYQGF